MKLSESDLQTLASRGITPEQLEQQLKCFATGFPYLKIYDSARAGAGITVLTDAEQTDASKRWDAYLAEGGRVAKFVPASGAASRMFKALFAFINGEEAQPKKGSDVAALLEGIHKFAFYPELETTVIRRFGKGVDALLEEGRAKDVVGSIILPEGMNYGQLPKGLLTFHRAEGGSVRTPVEEQLVEGAQTARQADGSVDLHLTVSPDHRKAFEAKLAEAVPAIEERMGVKIKVGLSEQMASTDTVAANEDNTPFRDAEGRMVFRPGGHGALIRNLNDIDSQVVFVKNIDNVVPDSMRGATIHYKKVLAGYLIELHDQVARYIHLIDERAYTEADLTGACAFLADRFSFDSPEMHTLKGEDLATYLRVVLDRPMRVCGMVKNEGEPGGGPYIAYNPTGSRSLQILESAQIDTSNPEFAAMMAKATHFNPVDLVCYVKDVYGPHFNLPDYVDPATGFISSKSLGGRPLKALELPGLWNGAMSNWLTAFVEVPVETFNPVKTVNDLLRPSHQ